MKYTNENINNWQTIPKAGLIFKPEFVESRKWNLVVFSPSRLLTLNNSTSPSASLKIKQQGDVKHVCLESYVCFWELLFLVQTLWYYSGVSDNIIMRIILITMMTFRINLTEESVWVTNAFSFRQLEFWNHLQNNKYIYWFSVWLYSAAPYKQSVNNSVPAITPTCTSHSDHLIRSCQCVMLQNVKFLYILFSPSIFRPDIRHLFSSFSVGQTAGIELW